MSKYNYNHFNPKDYKFTEFIGPKAGEQYIDFEATTLDGKVVSLSDYLNKPIVLDTGSITCPMYANTTKAMNALQDAYPEVHFLLLYIREAHPGKRTGAVTNFDEKMEHARATERLYGERREVLIDDLEGTAHKLYGSMPNMTYVISKSGLVKFRANWTDIDALQKVLKSIDDESIVREDFYDIKKPTPFVAVRTLLIGGFDALIEFLVSLPQLLRQHKEVKRGQ